MKPTHSFTSYFRLFALLALLISFSATTVYAQKDTTRRTSKQERFFLNIEKVKPGMSQADVRAIMGDPYKLSFELNDDELEESIFYQTEIYLGRYTLLIYECKFKNDKLVTLKQKEYLHLKDFPIEL